MADEKKISKVDARLPEPLMLKIKEFAFMHDRSVAWVIRTAVIQFLKNAS